MKTALIFSAGRGERLRPITDSMPKALCRVHNIPLVEYHIAKLVKSGFTRLVINHAYLGGQIRQQLGNGERWNIDICYAPEPPGGLETGGGIVNALSLLGNEPFLTVNADIFTDYNFSQFVLPQTSTVHLVLVNKPAYLNHGDFALSANKQLTNYPRQYTFAGIAGYRPELFRQMQPGRYSITPLLRELANEGVVTGEIYSGQWLDIGTVQRLQQVNSPAS